MKHLLILISAWLAFSNGICRNPVLKVEPSYLLKHDIVYQTPSYEAFEGFPLGNGDMGGLVWNHPNGIEAQINKIDLYDRSSEESQTVLRGGVRLKIDIGAPGYDWMYLDTFDARLSLRDAEAQFIAETPFAKSHIHSWISADKNVWCFQVKLDETGQLAEGSKLRVSLERWGSRTFPGWYGHFSKDTKNGLGHTQTKIQHNNLILEEQFDGLRFSVACRVLGVETASERISTHRIEAGAVQQQPRYETTILVSMVTSNESPDPTLAAIELLDRFEQKTVDVEKKAHADWWSSFWDQSFVHLGDDYIENLYYLRRYLMGSGSRGRYPLPFNGGIWTWNHDVRNWVTPHHWNTQQQYWGLCAQNDCELMLPYLNTYFRLMPEAEAFAKKRGADNAILWAEPHDFLGSMTFWEREDMVNNFTPALQIALSFWDYYQFTQDQDFLVQKAYPFMKKAAAFYVQKLQWDETKKEYFIYPSQPYESPRTNSLKNPVTDRNHLIALLNACVEASKQLRTDHAEQKKWNHILSHMWPLPYRQVPGVGEVIELAYNPDGSIFPAMEERGSWLNHFAANTSLAFPSNLVGLDQHGSREFNALTNMIRIHSPAINAISPDPIVAARLGLPDEILKMMQNGIRRLQQFPQGLFYNIDHWYQLSLYKDSLQAPDISAQRDYLYDQRTRYDNDLPAKPFIQCGFEPMSIYGATVNEMLLQSNGACIHIFPAVPKAWACAFKLRARGAFLISSERKNDGSVPGIFVESMQGKVCKIRNPWDNPDITVMRIHKKGQEKKVKCRIDKDGVIVFQTQPNAQYLVTNGKGSPDGSVYEGSPNRAPKYFQEAQLGKKKNF